MTPQSKQQVIVPAAAPEEDPVSFAQRLASWYSSQIADGYRKTLGIFFTPGSIARHMGALCRNGTGHFVRVLDPSAGTGILGCAAAVTIAESTNKPRHIELVCHEIDPGLWGPLDASLWHLQRWLSDRNVRFRYRIQREDFLLANAESLDAGLLRSDDPKFDAVICNPPYFKIPKSDERARACATVVHGQPNIYGLFMAVGASLIREGGRFVFITPRSFASGPYFKRFREFFFKRIRPTDIHVFDSRTDAFSEVLQETAITAGTRLGGWERRKGSQRLRLSSSVGASDIASAAIRTLPLNDVLKGDCAHRVLSFPASRYHDKVWAVVNKWPGSLHGFGWEVSTGPVVAFRAKELLRPKAARRTVPLLWLQNVVKMEVRWPLNARKAQYLLACPTARSILLPNTNYVVLRRFSAKEEERRLTAAPYLAKDFGSDAIGFENHLNFVHKPGGRLSVDEIYGLAALLNSRLLDAYFRISNGNTQVSATELRALPLPDLSVIRRIGARIRASATNLEEIVNEETGYAG